MVKKLFCLILMGLIITLLGGCEDAEKSEQEFDEVIPKEEPTELEELTEEEKVEDFKYMYNIMKENYVNLYDIDTDWLDMKAHFKASVKDTDDNYEFYQQMYNSLRVIDDFHLSIHDPETYFSNPEYDSIPERLQQFEDIYEHADKKYQGWKEIFNEKGYDIDPEQLPQEEQYLEDGVVNINTEIIEEGKIAYLQIHSFMIDSSEEIRNFMEEISDYPYLIIDIRGNKGGMLHWQDIFYNLEEVDYKSYLFSKGGDLANYFLEHKVLEDYNIDDIEEYPGYEDLPDYIQENFEDYIWKEKTIEPEDPLDFSGEIFILTDRYVYSASDRLVNFARITDLATVVGTRTRGGGMNGPQRLLYSLPNSGLVVEFEGFLGLNADGKNSYVGTEPDIEVETQTYQELIDETVEIIEEGRY
ncbi:S41 family peptidase [Natranaerobius thermophilus]|uniref:Peptidase S41 n=1 Tax=Natranaerobius thermophilus (strain ATCC BAA-1301 / DSM 18059 / JW/NM-WN-LF) TaxID=457570 RepID=B2A1A5_NATTJ|nr:S41 family peptidase [Natranaerobius thermophilus]ACB86043.1 peptidase S41 [Natranaerobius thermophilus JW/NM-WN-LF]